MKKRLIVGCLAAISLVTEATPRNVHEAMTCAERFATEKHFSGEMRLLEIAGNKSGKDAPYYIFGDDERCVIVGGTDLMPEIIGYADMAFDKEKISQNMQWWLDYVEKSAEVLERRPELATMAGNKGETKAVEPILKNINWGQGYGFNFLCPIDPEDNCTCYVGCVATATAQVIYHYRYPEKGTGYYEYDDFGVIRSMDFSKRTYNYDLMFDYFDIEDTTGAVTYEQLMEASKLSYDVALMSTMSFSSYASGTDTRCAGHGLVLNMGYDSYLQSISRLGYTNEEWTKILNNELYHNRPVIYDGMGGGTGISIGGHCFVLDGLDTEGRYHINWGWSGYLNGYFCLDLFNPYDDPEAMGYDGLPNAMIQIAPNGMVEDAKYYNPLSGKFTEMEFDNVPTKTDEECMIKQLTLINMSYSDEIGYIGLAFMKDDEIVAYTLEYIPYIITGNRYSSQTFSYLYDVKVRTPKQIANGTYRVLPCYKRAGGDHADEVSEIRTSLVGDLVYYCDVNYGKLKMYKKSPGTTAFNPVKSIENDKKVRREGTYDLQGRRMREGEKLTKGVYVVNGEKRIVR